MIGPELEGFAIDVSDHPDINELMLVSDVLVTDYSSAIYEFALLGRPMAFFAPDYEAYERRARLLLRLPDGRAGADLRDQRGARRRTCGPGEFDLERVERFRRESFDVADGRSTARVTDELIVPASEPGGQTTIDAAARSFEGSVYHTAALHPRPQCRPCDRN